MSEAAYDPRSLTYWPMAMSFPQFLMRLLTRPNLVDTRASARRSHRSRAAGRVIIKLR